MKVKDEIAKLLKTCVERNASDLHIVVGLPPVIRLGVTFEYVDALDLRPADVESLIYGMLNARQKEILERDRELDTEKSSMPINI